MSILPRRSGSHAFQILTNLGWAQSSLCAEHCDQETEHQVFGLFGHILFGPRKSYIIFPSIEKVGNNVSFFHFCQTSYTACVIVLKFCNRNQESSLPLICWVTFQKVTLSSDPATSKQGQQFCLSYISCVNEASSTVPCLKYKFFWLYNHES